MMKSTKCYLCGMDDTSMLFNGSKPEIELNVNHLAARKGSINKEYSYNWVKCKVCGLVYANPIPEEKTLQKCIIDV